MKPKGTEGDRWRRRLQRARVALSLSGGAVSGGGRGGRGVCRTSFFSGHWRRSVPVLPSFVAPSAGGGASGFRGGRQLLELWATVPSGGGRHFAFFARALVAWPFSRPHSSTPLLGERLREWDGGGVCDGRGNRARS